MKPTQITRFVFFFVITVPLLMCTAGRPPLSSVVLRSKLDKKIVALNVHLRDHRLAKIAQDIAMGKLSGSVDTGVAMAGEGVPFPQWAVFRGETDDLDAYVQKLRRLSPARCGMVDKPVETAICARAVVNLNKVPTSGSTGQELRVQGAAQGSARVEEVLLMGPDGKIVGAKVVRKERSFEATVTPDGEAGLYTFEVLARTGRGIEPAARWWVKVGSASYPEQSEPAAESEETKDSQLVQTGFANLNQDRQSVGANKITWSAKLSELAAKRAKEYAAQGAVSPPDQEALAKLRIEGNKALTRYSETLAAGDSVAAIQAEIMVSPSKRRTHLDVALSSGAVGVARGRAPDTNIYMIEVMGRAYNPENPGEFRTAIVDRINVARERSGATPLKVFKPLERYADKTAKQNMKRNKFFEKDDMGRTMTDAILADIDGLMYAGSEMFKVYGAEEVTPGATPSDKRFSLVGVGVARKGEAWWVVILVGTPE